MTAMIRLFAGVLVLAMATPASAQVKVRDHRKGKQKAPKVTASGLSPDRGAVGTQVTITGSGFTPDTEVLIGGHFVRVDDVRPKQLTITIPAKHGDGYIVLRHPDVARDIDVGAFTVLIDMTVDRFAPTSGSPGTRVAITGEGFENGDTVLMNGQSIQINKLSANKIVVTIPANATTDYLVIARGSDQVRSAKRFTVTQSAPVIERIVPEAGAAGSTITIIGQNFAPDDKPYYGKVAMEVVQRGTNTIDARIPPKATQNSYIRVVGAAGQYQLPTEFVLEKPPEITRITPDYGQVGDQVEIYGSNFRADDDVLLGNKRLDIVQVRATQLSVRIPRGAKSGLFVVQRGATQIVSAHTFDVVYEPVITNFSPNGGEVGTRVTVTGRHFTADAIVYYGAEKLRIIELVSDSQLVVKIPRGASDQLLTVRTRGGDATASSAFSVQTHPTVSQIKPRDGFAGTRITVRGSNLREVDGVYIGPVSLPIVERHAKYVVAEIPANTSSGVVYIARYNEMFKTKYSFTVLEDPGLQSFTPSSGTPGTHITINGANFTRDTVVSFGDQVMTIVTRNLPSQLVVELPAKASGTRYVWLRDGAAEVRSTSQLTVIPAPAITGFSPREGKAGTQVTITGHDFSKDTEVLLDRVPARVVRRSGTNEIIVEIPAGTSKAPYLSVVLGASSARAQRAFKVLPSATLTKLSAHDITVGGELIIYGNNLDDDTRVFFGNAELAVAKVGPKGKRLWIDANITGSDYIVIDDLGVQSRSKKKLTVNAAPADEPAPAPVKVRDHRKK